MAKNDKTTLRTSVEAEVVTDGAQQNVTELSRLLGNLQATIDARKKEMVELAAQQQQVIDNGQTIETEAAQGGGPRDAGEREDGSLVGNVGGFLAKSHILKKATGLGHLGRAGALALPAVVLAAPSIEEAAYGIGNAMSKFTNQDGVQKFNPWYIGKATVNWAGEKLTDAGKAFVGGSGSLFARLSTLGPLGDAQGYDTLEEKEQRAESIKRQVIDGIFGRDPEMIRRWDDKVGETVIRQAERLRLADSAIVGELAGLGLSGDITQALAKSLSAENLRRRQSDAVELENRLKLKNEAAYESGDEIEAE